MNSYQVKTLSDEIAYFMCRLYQQGLTTTSGGNISARYGENILITPSATDKGRMKCSEIGMLNMDCGIVGAEFKPTIESRMHLEIYKRRPDVKAVVHAHPVTASAFAASSHPIGTKYLAESLVILGDIAYAPYARMGSNELAEVVGDAAEKSNCIVMRNHGVIALGDNLLQAFDRLEVMENAAKITLICQGALAGDSVELSNEQVQELKAEFCS
jgi:L-fuculose-phosphate aldolase